jgi:hypothetical protein
MRRHVYACMHTVKAYIHTVRGFAYTHTHTSSSDLANVRTRLRSIGAGGGSSFGAGAFGLGGTCTHERTIMGPSPDKYPGELMILKLSTIFPALLLVLLSRALRGDPGEGDVIGIVEPLNGDPREGDVKGIADPLNGDPRGGDAKSQVAGIAWPRGDVA